MQSRISDNMFSFFFYLLLLGTIRSDIIMIVNNELVYIYKVP